MRAYQLRAWFMPSHLAAGFIAVVVGYTSSAALIFQAAHAAGASSAEIASWLWALGVGMGITSIGLSLYFRSPILTAWSTPGAALLATSLTGVSLPAAMGAFLFSSLLITLAGVSGVFERVMHHIPKALAAAMLAGILLRFGLNLFTPLPTQGLLLGVMFVSFLLLRRYQTVYAVPLTLLVGITVAFVQGQVHWADITVTIAHPVLILPVFSLSTLLGVGIPLCIVTMASQNIPGLAVLRANGYGTPVSPLISVTGITGIILAPFGGFAFNLAAITAAICMSPDADPDPQQRYRAAVWAGIFYCLTGIFGATVVSVFAAVPNALILAIAGLALLATIGNSLATALLNEEERDAALVTFLTTASGLTLLGIGSAFWGVVFGCIAYGLGRRRARG